MKIEVIENSKGFEHLESVWDILLNSSSNPNFFQSFTWLKHWWETFNKAQNLKLHILVFSINNNIISIAPLMLVPKHFWGIKYYVLQFIGTTGTNTTIPNRFDQFFSIDNSLGWCDQCDFIPNQGNHHYEVLNTFWSYLLSWKKWDMIDLRELNAQSPTVAYLKEKQTTVSSLLFAQRRAASSYTLPLQGTFEQYLKSLSKNNRKNFKSSKNRINKSAQASYIGVAKTPDTVAEIMPRIKKLEKICWKAEGLAGCFSEEYNNIFHTAVAQKLAERGELEINYFIMDDRLVAYNFLFFYNSKLYAHITSYDSGAAYYSPGMYLLMHVIEAAYKRGLSEFNFCRALTPFKARFKPVEVKRTWWIGYRRRLVPRLLRWAEFSLKKNIKSALNLSVKLMNLFLDKP